MSSSFSKNRVNNILLSVAPAASQSQTTTNKLIFYSEMDLVNSSEGLRKFYRSILQFENWKQIQISSPSGLFVQIGLVEAMFSHADVSCLVHSFNTHCSAVFDRVACSKRLVSPG